VPRVNPQRQKNNHKKQQYRAEPNAKIFYEIGGDKKLSPRLQLVFERISVFLSHFIVIFHRKIKLNMQEKKIFEKTLKKSFVKPIKITIFVSRKICLRQLNE
jgi:hypothetical protein